MRKKQNILPCFLSAVAILCFVFFSPAFAAMEKVDESELARTNASVTGESVIKNLNCVDKDGICVEIMQDNVTSDKVAVASSPAAKSTTTGVIDLNLNISGQTTFQYHFGGATTNMTGGITSVTSR